MLIFTFELFIEILLISLPILRGVFKVGVELYPG